MYLTPPNSSKYIRSYPQLEKWLRYEADRQRFTNYDWNVINFREQKRRKGPQKQGDEEVQNDWRRQAEESFLTLVKHLKDTQTSEPAAEEDDRAHAHSLQGSCYRDLPTKRVTFLFL